MKTEHSEAVDIPGLMREVRRYLAAVEIFRAEGREPHWLREWPPTDEPESRLDRLVIGAPPIP